LGVIVLIIAVGFGATTKQSSDPLQVPTLNQSNQNSTQSVNQVSTKKSSGTSKVKSNSNIGSDEGGPESQCPRCGSKEYYDINSVYDTSTGTTTWTLKCLKCNATWTVKQ